MEKKQKGLSSWQLTMMSLGTVIGGSFFLGSSVAINAAGPSILISYVVGGVLVYFILFALTEMTVANPDSGSFRTFAWNNHFITIFNTPCLIFCKNFVRHHLKI
jgi:L-asparagine transporter-like permease